MGMKLGRREERGEREEGGRADGPRVFFTKLNGMKWATKNMDRTLFSLEKITQNMTRADEKKPHFKIGSGP